MSIAGTHAGTAPLAGEDHLRNLFAIAGAIATLAGCLGLTSHLIFSQPSTLKYLLTIAGPVGVTLLAGAADPLRALTVLTIVTAPFTFVTTVQGIALTPLDLFGAAALVLFTFGVSKARSPTLVGIAATLGFALLAPGVIRASAPLHFMALLGTMFAIGLLANKLVRTRGGIETLLGAVVASATLQALIAIWEFITHRSLDLYSASGQAAISRTYFFAFENAARPAAALPDPISLGNVLALAVPLALALLFHGRNLLHRVLLVLAVAVITLALALTLSRMSWIGATVGAGVVLCLLPKHRLRATLFVACTVAVSLVLALALGGNALRQRFESVSNPTARGVSTAASDRQRESLWRGALQVATEHKALGTGLGNLDTELSRFVGVVAPATHAHSTYLQLLAETGIVGLSGVALILLATLSELLLGLSWRPELPAGLLGALAAVLVCWTTDYTVRYLQVAVFVAVVIGAAAGISGQRAGWASP